MSMLTRSTILNAADLDRELVSVPEWGGDVFVRGMNGTERDRYELGMYTAREDLETKAIIRARVVAFCTVNEDGSSLFTPADIAVLGTKSAVALDRIFTVAMRLSGTDTDAPAGADSAFLADPSGPSTSDSPATSV